MWIPLLLGCLGTGPGLELTTDTLHAHLDDTGHFTSLVDPRDGTDYLPADQAAPLARIRIEGAYLEPTAMRRTDGTLHLEFANGALVTVTSAARSSHLRFEVRAVQTPEPIELVMWGPYPTTINGSIGETIGVVRGDRYALGVQGMNAKTLGGAARHEHDQMPSYDIFESGNYTDVGEDVKVLYRGDAALRTAFGSTIQAYTRDRSQARVIENWGHPRFAVPAFDDGGIIGSAIALFGCPVEDALATIGAIEIAEGLPHPMIDGEWAKTAPGATAAYLIIGFGEDTIDDAIALTERAGLKYLYHGGPFTKWGTFELNGQQFPNGWDGMKACVDRAAQKGLGVGVHTLSNFITTNDPLVTPVPDPGLAVVGTTELQVAIDAAAKELVVADGGWFENHGALRAARIGDELIQYVAVEGNRLLECERGAFGTTAASHPEGASVSKLIDHAYRTFLTDATLSRRVSETIADLFNQTGLRQISFDGLEGNWSTGMGQYGRTLFAEWWYDALKPELRGKVITDASNPGHYFWHLYTRMNWGEPWYAGFRESQTQYRLMNQRYFERNLMPRMLGWFQMGPATSLEDAEWLLARSAGFNAGYALVTSPDAVAKNGFGDEILHKIRLWETTRLAGEFSEGLLPALQDISREFTLEEQEDLRILTEIHCVRGTHARREQPGMPTTTEFEADNPFLPQAVHFILRCTGKVAAEEIVLEVAGREYDLGVSLPPGEALRWVGGEKMVIHDGAWQEVRRHPVDPDRLRVPQGSFPAKVTCRFAGSEPPELKVELRLHDNPIALTHRCSDEPK